MPLKQMAPSLPMANTDSGNEGKVQFMSSFGYNKKVTNMYFFVKNKTEEFCFYEMLRLNIQVAAE